MAVCVAAAVTTGLATHLVYDGYLSRLACFNAQGRCFDPETGVVYHAQSGMIWGGLAVIGALATVLLCRAARR